MRPIRLRATIDGPSGRRALPRRILAAAAAAFLVSALGISGAHALQIKNLKSPQSFLATPSGQIYFITNVNGEPTEKDNNGFITKLDKEGKLIELEFIRGGRGQTVLHAPKGMAIVGNVLYVVDIDTLRGFDVESGRPLVAISIAADPAGEATSGLTDVAFDGQHMLYVSDTDTNAIYRVDLANEGHTLSLLTRDQRLAGPRGLAVHPRTGHLICVSWNQGSIIDISPAGVIEVLVSNSFFSRRFTNLDGVDFDTWGSMYVSDFTAGKVWRVTPDENFKVIAEYLPTPADISVDKANHLILVPYIYGNAAEINGLEAPVQAKRKKKRRTLRDYGFPFMKPKVDQQRDGDE